MTEIRTDFIPAIMEDDSEGPFNSAKTHFNPPYNWLIGSAFGLLSVASIVGNFLVLLIIIRYKRMRTPTNLLLGNLASIDFLTGLLAIPFSAITAITVSWKLGETACQINGFLNALFAAASTHTLMYIAVQTYLSIRSMGSSLKTRYSVKYTIVMMVSAWLWGFLFATGLVSGWTKIEYKNGTTQCGPKIPDRTNIREISHSIFTSISIYVIPFAVIFFCYVSVFHIFKQSLERLQNDFQALSKRDYLFRQRKIAITLVIIFLAFLICLTPYICYSTTLAFFKDKTQVPAILNPVAYFFFHLSSCINPVIYALRSNDFAAAYRNIRILKIFCGKRTGFAKATDKPSGVTPGGLRRRSLEAVRFLARKTQKMNQLQFEYRLSTSPVISMWSVSRIPRRRSLSMWSIQRSEDSVLAQEFTGFPAQTKTRQETEMFSSNSENRQSRTLLVRFQRAKSTIPEEHSSQLDSSSLLENTEK